MGTLRAGRARFFGDGSPVEQRNRSCPTFSFARRLLYWLFATSAMTADTCGHFLKLSFCFLKRGTRHSMAACRSTNFTVAIANEIAKCWCAPPSGEEHAALIVVQSA